MHRERSRRALLGGLGVVALAGCLAGSGDRGTDGRETTPGGGSGTTTSSDDGTTTSSDDGTTAPPGTEPDPPDRVESDWPTPAHDPGLSNYAAGAVGPTDPVAELWTASTEVSLSAPVVAEETLYVGGNDGVVRAFDARTGERRWQQSVGGPAGTPRVRDGRAFVPVREDPRRGVVALDAADGTEVWHAGSADPSEMVVADHGIYRVAGGAHLDVVAHDRADGAERWRTDVDQPWVPVLFAGEETVYLSSGDEGRIPWQFDPETGDLQAGAPREGYDFYASRFHFDGSTYSVDPFFGAIRGDGWGQDLDAAGDVRVSAGANHVFYVGDAGDSPGLYALSRADGAVEWSTGTVTSVVERPLAAEEAVVLNAGEAVLALDPTDGTELWSRPGEAFGDALALADDLLFTTVEGEVRAFRPP